MDQPTLPADPAIRALRPDEAPVWRDLRLAALRDHPDAFSDSYEEASARDLDAFRVRVPPPGGPAVLFGAFARGTLAGAAGFAPETAIKMRHKGLLWGVYVSPEFRGRGLAEQLVRRVLDHARAHVDIVQAAVGAGNASARRLYERLGFVSYGEEPAALRVGGVNLNEVLLWIDLRRAADSLPSPSLSDRRAP